LLDLIYPPRCVLCGRHGSFICDACVAGLPRADGARCDRCWLPLGPQAFCHACDEHPSPVSSLRSVFRYDGEVRRLVHAFKFGGISALGPKLGLLMTQTFDEQGLEAEVIVPVPLAGARRRTRGYNQAELLARELGKGTWVPLSEALRKRRLGPPQAGSASAEERRRNVAGAFEVSRPGEVAGLRVLLVDDVATTGATLDACALALFAAGASDVLAITLARED
jgi:ComF family protein